MTILSHVYSGHAVDDPLIPCLEIFSDGFPDRILNCNGFEDHTVTLETGEVVNFIASGMDVALPAKDASGQQMLRFAIENVTDNGYRLVKESMDAGHSIRLVYREYLANDLSAPAKAPLRMIVTQPEFEGATLQVTAAFNDLTNRDYPPRRYNTTWASGLRYFK